MIKMQPEKSNEELSNAETVEISQDIVMKEESFLGRSFAGAIVLGISLILVTGIITGIAYLFD
jgi:hypothetical protein